MKEVQKGLFETKDPEFDSMKSYARREAVERRMFVNRDPNSGIPKVVVYDEKTLPELVVSPSTPPDDRRRQAYMILTDEPIITDRRGLLDRLVNAATSAGMRVDFNQGNVRGVEFVDPTIESMDYRVVRGSYGFQLPREFERARRVYDDVVRRLR